LHYAVKRGVVKQLPSLHYKVKVPIKKVEYLTQEEIDRIESKEIRVERLNIIRDLFIFSCYSGLSYTEMRNLHESHLQTIDSQIWIDMMRQKTKRSLKIPLLPKCVSIIEKYELHITRKSKGLILPVPTNQKFNSYLKELNDLCSITTPLTCHLGRRSFSTTILLRNKIHVEAISKMLGHANSAITIKSYMGNVPELIMSEFEKIKEIYHKE
jgi:integrase